LYKAIDLAEQKKQTLRPLLPNLMSDSLV